MPTQGRGSAPSRANQSEVPSEVYTTDYFLSGACEGYDEYKSGSLSLIKRHELELLDARRGQRVLDLGCGRGEVIAELAEQGMRVIGVDYAEAAVSLSQEIADGRAAVARADATALPFRSGSFDRVLMGDVIEHLTWDLGVRALREVERVLAPGGRALIHTSPNRWFVTYVLPVAKIGLYVMGEGVLVRRFGEYEERRGDMHPNELSPVGMTRIFREAGVRGRSWVDSDVLRSGASAWTSNLSQRPVTRAIGAAAGSWPLRTLLGNDLYGVIEKGA